MVRTRIKRKWVKKKTQMNVDKYQMHLANEAEEMQVKEGYLGKGTCIITCYKSLALNVLLALLKTMDKTRSIFSYSNPCKEKKKSSLVSILNEKKKIHNRRK
jgi:hypothetical protein